MGQWRYEHDNDVSFDGEDESYSEYYAVLNEDESLVARVEWESDAKLIAAAPELLEALQCALEWIDNVPSDARLPMMPGFDRDWVDGIIAKALGE